MCRPIRNARSPQVVDGILWKACLPAERFESSEHVSYENAKIYKRFSKKITYIIIDIPIFTCLQWLYLSSIFGEKNVNLIKNISDNIENEKINLIPVVFIENYNLNGDLFISTWALSESNEYSQELVIKKNWFNAPHLLLAQGSPSNSTPYNLYIGNYAKQMDINLEIISFLPNCSYGYR